MDSGLYHQKLSNIFRDKPELVTRFPDWMLSTERLEAMGHMENPAIVEIAGRDSVAAAVQGVAENDFTDLIPVYAYTGTEYGNWTNVTQAVERLVVRLPATRVHQLLVMGSPALWRALNARFVDEWISRFQYYSPCPGCHLYLHAVRIPLAKRMGGIPIISGERESHSGVVKINQTAPALDVYSDLARRFDVRLILPLRHITQGEEIEAILKMHWARDEEQLKCVFSGNYRRRDGSVGPSAADVQNYFTKFAIPVAEAAISAYMSEDSPDVEGIARQILQGIPEQAREI
jgi:hypothetical protein